MKKVVSINLAGKMFYFDEDAYNHLDNVLSGQWKKEELEAQIAEKLAPKLNANKTVIAYPDVVDALYQLGLTPTESRSVTDTLRNKRLYRQPNGKMLGGVCTGIAEYLEIDPVIIRVLFVIAFFLGSMGFWLYIVLWIVVPKAPTALKV